MSEEIRRIGHLVDYFDYPFHPHAGFLRNYKKVKLNFLVVLCFEMST